jgi:glutathione S-transferase
MRLTYWKKRGRGEQVRLLLHELDLSYEENYVAKGDAFRALQAEGPSKLTFGSIPMLEEGSFCLVQGPVILSYLARSRNLMNEDEQMRAKADSIAWGAEDLRIQYFRLFGPNAARDQAAFVEGIFQQRWLPAFEGLLKLNGNASYFVGSQLSHADVAVWDIFDSLLEWVPGVTLDQHPRLQTFFQSFKERRRIAAYLESERRLTS